MLLTNPLIHFRICFHSKSENPFLRKGLSRVWIDPKIPIKIYASKQEPHPEAKFLAVRQVKTGLSNPSQSAADLLRRQRWFIRARTFVGGGCWEVDCLILNQHILLREGVHLWGAKPYSVSLHNNFPVALSQIRVLGKFLIISSIEIVVIEVSNYC